MSMKPTQTTQSANKLAPRFTVKNARFSQLSKLPLKFAYILLDLIGTHELANNLSNNQVQSILNSLLKYGYEGPAISAIEREGDVIYDTILTNQVQVLDNISYGQLGIADGHNRLEALKILQAQKILKHQYIPIQIIPGRKPEIVSLRASKIDETPLTIEQIESCFTNPNLTIDPKSTTHFEAAFRDGQWRRVREGQPNIIIKREELIDDV